MSSIHAPLCRVSGQLEWKTHSDYGGEASESMRPALINLSRHNTDGWIQPSEEIRPEVWHLGALLEHRAVRGRRNTQSLSWVEWTVVVEKKMNLKCHADSYLFSFFSLKVMAVIQVDTVDWSNVCYWCCTEHWLPTAFWWVYRETRDVIQTRNNFQCIHSQTHTYQST